MQKTNPYHVRLLEVLQQNIEKIHTGVDLLVAEILRTVSLQKCIWIIGNGGSASTAEHFQTDLTYATIENLNSHPKVEAITSNSSLITAIANDLSFGEVFETILRRKVRSGDLLISISASGNSPNVLKAINFAKSKQVKTFTLLGFDGGQAVSTSDYSVVIDTEIGEYGIVEDIHLSMCHAVSAAIKKVILS